MYTSSPASLFLLLAAQTGLSHGYWRMGCGVVQTGRLDPVVSPGKISGHVHKISGPSNIGLNSTYDSVRSASCTSCSVQADKSAYWTPQLYYHHSNGSFEEVPNSGHVVYYLGRGDNRTNIQPFPPGFRMLSGDAGARAYNNTSFTFGGTNGATYVNGTVGSGSLTGGTWVDGTKANGPKFFGRPVSDRTSFNCLDASPLPETPKMVRTNCTNGLRAQIHFQSCWDGVNLYKSDNSHVAYMSQIDNGVCPPGYPVQFVHLFFEVLYGTNNIKLDGGQFVFSQGDTTGGLPPILRNADSTNTLRGYGFHGDFLNGWDMPTQKAALSQCANTDNGGQISACAPLAVTDSSEYSANCPQQPALINEPARGMISKLPGCITITSGPNEATSADMVCPANVPLPSVNPTPTSTGPAVTFLPAVGNVYSSWKYMGCANETVNGRALTGASYTDNSGMTNEACQAFCTSKNYPVAATEYGSQCYCGLSLDPTVSLSQTCNGIICSGNRSEICGGNARMSVWNSTTYKGPYKPFPSAAGVLLGSSVYLGCATDGGASHALPAASFSDGTSMTLNACQSFCAAKNFPIWGTEYASECYCAASLPPISLSTLTDTFTCAMACSGNSSQICGGPNRLTLFNNTAIRPAPSAPAPNTPVGSAIYLGCASEATSGRALSASSYADNSMTNAVCAAYCASKNFNLFGTEYGRECYCGNALAAGASLGQTGCSMPCPGTLPAGSPFASYANTCGGSGRLSLWNDTAYKPVQVVASVGKYMSKGCYAEGTKGRALASASWSQSNMTVEACVGYCSGKGWGYAGVEYAQECYCGSGISNGGAPAGDGCGMVCGGSQYEYCGGPGRLNVYASS